MFDMMNMLGKIKEVQAKVKEAKDNLVNITVTSEAGAGMVKATINGNRKIVKLDIDPEMLKSNDKEMIQDLVVAAVNKGMEEIEEKIKESLKKSTEGLLPNIPGLDLGNII
ncbi:YbaB/EbfC family nucleoid-associated protein [Sporocytophaga myxococcoides]|nr:YbaB/EbfC family nucleoid-associated protein [Sporocytophaga myxococcoides]